MASQDILFRGATRPPMVFGVPTTPLMIVGLAIILLTVYISLKWVFVMVPAVVIMQALTKYDEQIFELLGLRIKTALKTLGNSKTAKRDTLVLPHGAKRDNWY